MKKNETLLTVSGTIDPSWAHEIVHGNRPRADYFAMSKAFNADILDYSEAEKRGGVIGRLLGKFAGKPAMLAWAAFKLRKEYRAIFTDGEQIGVPLAILLKLFAGKERPSHLMIVHILSVFKKMILFNLFKIKDTIDYYCTYSTWQKQFIETTLEVDASHVKLTPFMVDDKFFSPEADQEVEILDEIKAKGVPIISAVGLEARDYATLIEAIRGLDVHLVIAAASPWSKRADETEQMEIPDNVTVQRFTHFQLRHLYAISEFFTMPLKNVGFQAGVTAILEAMAMEKAVICTSTPGQTDVITEGETGMYVPPNDVDEWRQTITFLLDNPVVAQRMGRNGRSRIVHEMSLDKYTQRLAIYVQQAINEGKSNVVTPAQWDSVKLPADHHAASTQ